MVFTVLLRRLKLFSKVKGQQVNGIRPCGSVNFAAGPASSYGGDGNRAVSACLH